MPELVEVENFRQLLLRLVAKDDDESESNQLSFLCPSPTPPKTFPSKPQLEMLKSCTVKDVERKGKLLRLVLLHTSTSTSTRTMCSENAETMFLYLHMGMTGRISIPDYVPSLESLKENDPYPPPHTHLILKCGEEEVAYSDPRRFGAVSMDMITSINMDMDKNGTSSGPLASQWNEFATDALDPNLTLDGLVGCSKGIKALILDQRAHCSGVGNWIADEICYQCQLHPDQNFLTVEEVESIQVNLATILKTGIECLTLKQTFPDDWIFHRRWSKPKTKTKTTRSKQKQSSSKTIQDANGKTVKFITSAGRSSAIVPIIQKKQNRTAPTCTDTESKVDVINNTKRRRSKQANVNTRTSHQSGDNPNQVKEESELSGQEPSKRRRIKSDGMEQVMAEKGVSISVPGLRRSTRRRNKSLK